MMSIGGEGVSIMPTLYKVYTAALVERLREDVEGKKLIPSHQAGFRILYLVSPKYHHYKTIYSK